MTLTRKKHEGVIDKAAGTADARNKIDHIHWYIPHFTPSIQQQGTLSNQTLGKIPYFEYSAFMKEVNNQNLWNFELGNQENMKVPV